MAILKIQPRLKKSKMSLGNDMLIKGLKNGDEGAFRALYKLHYEALCLIAMDLVKDFYMADALVNDLIVSIWKNRKTLQIKQSLRAYLVKGIRNRCLSYLDHNRRKEKVYRALYDSYKYEQLSYETQQENPFYLLLEKELDGQIKSAIEKLPILTRDVFLASRHRGMTYEEIAKEKELSVDSIKYHIKSALSKLRDELQDYLLFFTPFIIFI